MDEEKVGTEATEEDFASFDEGWGDEPEAGDKAAEEAAAPEEAQKDASETGGEAKNDGAETGEGETATTNQSEGGDSQTGEAGDTGEQKAESKDGAEYQRFDLTYMHETRSVDRNEVITLAQKGMDYDRIRGNYDSLTREIEDLGGMDNVRSFAGLIKDIADSSGMSTEQVIDNVSGQIIARRDKVSPEVAAERAKAERLQRASEARTRQEKENASKADAETQKRNEDFAAFIKAYPGVDAKSIPQEVWDEVRAGKSLVTAYAVYDAKTARAEAEQLRSEMTAAKKNDENRQKAAPTTQSAGNKSTTPDAFDEGWGDD